VADYRAYLVGLDGHIIGYEPIICRSDTEAIALAQRHIDGVHAVEVWSVLVWLPDFSGNPAVP
jgi:hypothetical protein